MFEFTPNAQTWPRSVSSFGAFELGMSLMPTICEKLNTDIGGDTGSTYLVVGNLGSSSGKGLDFIMGLTFLERFYSAFDSETPQFGIATTAYTNSMAN